jgi:hypothetical protein
MAFVPRTCWYGSNEGDAISVHTDDRARGRWSDRQIVARQTAYSIACDSRSRRYKAVKLLQPKATLGSGLKRRCPTDRQFDGQRATARLERLDLHTRELSRRRDDLPCAENLHVLQATFVQTVSRTCLRSHTGIGMGPATCVHVWWCV